MAGMFTASGLVLLALVRTQSESAGIVSHVSFELEARMLALALLVWIACFAVIHWFLNRQHCMRDPLLLPVAALLHDWRPGFWGGSWAGWPSRQWCWCW